jgi:hypothetical protein
MKNEISKRKQSIDGELLFEPYEIEVDPEQLKIVIESIEPTSFTAIYNPKIFEKANHIIHVEDEWLFWDDNQSKFLDWDWVKDLDEIINSFEDEYEIEDLNSGWIVADNNEYPEEYSKYLYGNLIKENKPVSTPIEIIINSSKEYSEIKNAIIPILDKYRERGKSSDLTNEILKALKKFK